MKSAFQLEVVGISWYFLWYIACHRNRSSDIDFRHPISLVCSSTVWAADRRCAKYPPSFTCERWVDMALRWMLDMASSVLLLYLTMLEHHFQARSKCQSRTWIIWWSIACGSCGRGQLRKRPFWRCLSARSLLMHHVRFAACLDSTVGGPGLWRSRGAFVPCRKNVLDSRSENNCFLVQSAVA